MPQPGDFFLLVGNDPVGRLIRVGEWLNGDGFSQYSHAFVLLDDDTILEAEPGGACIRPVTEYPTDLVAWSSWPLTGEQRTAVVAAARGLLGVPYSFADYFALAAHRLHIPAPGLRRYLMASYTPPATLDRYSAIRPRRSAWTAITMSAIAELDVHNVSLVKWALDQCGAVGVGVNLPNAAMSQFDAGQPWDVVTNDGGIDGGHAVALVGYDVTGPVFVTWGAVQRATWAWWNTYVEEAWLSLTADFVNAHSGDDPLGATLYELGHAFAAIAGKPNPVPAPIPSPTPPPGPTPTPVPPAPTPDTDPADLALVATLTAGVAPGSQR